MPLFLAPIDADLRVAKVIAEDKVKKHLENMGILPGQIIRIISSSRGDMILRIKDGRVALNKELAMKIFIFTA